MTQQTTDIRSKQRLENLKKALKLYEEAVSPKMSRLEEEGLIHRFEYTFELSWKYLQDLLFERGYTNVRGPKPVIEQAFQDGIITDGPIWMDMLRCRNETTHLYNEALFENALKKIKKPYLEVLKKINKP